MSHKQMLPVWFFIGILLFIYGIIILATALSGVSSHSPTVLAEYHPGLWGGIILIMIGGVYSFLFRPKRHGKE
jgi:hypothetical protein